MAEEAQQNALLYHFLEATCNRTSDPIGAQPASTAAQEVSASWSSAFDVVIRGPAKRGNLGVTGTKYSTPTPGCFQTKPLLEPSSVMLLPAPNATTGLRNLRTNSALKTVRGGKLDQIRHPRRLSWMQRLSSRMSEMLQTRSHKPELEYSV
jgi:hypothetical protein